MARGVLGGLAEGLRRRIGALPSLDVGEAGADGLLHPEPAPAPAGGLDRPQSARPARLRLRPMGTGDAVAVRDGRRRPGWAADYPASGDRVVARLVLEVGPVGEPFGTYLVVEADTGDVVGAVGCHGRPVAGEVEVGYGIVPSRQGSGYATEALRLLLDRLWAAGVASVRAETVPANVASRRVLERCGFALVGEDAERARYRLGAPG